MAETAGSDPERCKRGALLRTIPNGFETGAVTTGNTTLDLGSFGAGTKDLRGKWVWLQARGGNITMRRYKTGESDPTLTAGQGFTLISGDAPTEVWIDPNGGTKLRVIGSVACSLDAHYDSEV